MMRDATRGSHVDDMTTFAITSSVPQMPAVQVDQQLAELRIVCNMAALLPTK